MSELLAPFGAPPEAVGRHAEIAEASPRTPVSITGQQVLFATAAAVPLQPAKTGRSWIDAVRGFLTAAFMSSSNEPRPKSRHYPARNDFLEESRMAREMFRL
jgi:hypothetical protein